MSMMMVVCGYLPQALAVTHSDPLSTAPPPIIGLEWLHGHVGCCGVCSWVCLAMSVL